MVYVDIEKCTGCGTCAEACLEGAISIAEGAARIDQEKCTDCEACVEVCPNGAMLAVREPLAERAVVPIVRPAAEVIQVKPQPAPVSLRSRAAPAVSAAAAALTFLGRNIAPRLADYLLNALDRRLSQEPASPAARTSTGVSPASGMGGRGPSTGPSSDSGRSSGRSFRRRRRQGQG